MIRKIILPTILLILAYGFWISPNFKEISAGVAIFLFGMLFLEEGFKAFTGGGCWNDFSVKPPAAPGNPSASAS